MIIYTYEWWIYVDAHDKEKNKATTTTTTIDNDIVVEIETQGIHHFMPSNKIEIKIHPELTGRQGKDIGDVKFNSDGDGMGRYR